MYIYNYIDAMKNDILSALIYEKSDDDLIKIATDMSDISSLYDYFWLDDGVTGNAGGSYTYNAEKAKEYVLDNIDILNEAMLDLCISYEEIGKMFINEKWEEMDVTIRCYLLNEATEAAVDFMKQIYNDMKDKNIFISTLKIAVMAA